ncbi:hypothetical protein D1872_310010 [compost metagenome]
MDLSELPEVDWDHLSHSAVLVHRPVLYVGAQLVADIGLQDYEDVAGPAGPVGPDVDRVMPRLRVGLN